MPWAEDAVCFTVDDLLSEEECARLIELSESYGYEQALVNIGGGEQTAMPEYRNSSRWMVDSEDAAALLWSRLTLIPEAVQTKMRAAALGATTLTEWRPVGLNPRLRFLRYTPGDYFAPHSDGAHTCMEIRQRSFMTVMLYLNTPASGGETNFPHPPAASFAKPIDDGGHVSVQPTTGAALLFDHEMYHEGALLREGVKYAIRTDVMFERV